MNLMNVCTRHLVAIGAALQAYEKDHGDFPEWLSELHPKPTLMAIRFRFSNIVGKLSYSIFGRFGVVRASGKCRT